MTTSIPKAALCAAVLSVWAGSPALAASYSCDVPTLSKQARIDLDDYSPAAAFTTDGLQVAGASATAGTSTRIDLPGQIAVTFDRATGVGSLVQNGTAPVVMQCRATG